MSVKMMCWTMMTVCMQNEELTTPAQTLERKAATDPETQTIQAISSVTPTIASENISIVSNISPRPPALPHQPLLIVRKQATRLLIPVSYKLAAEVIPVVEIATEVSVGAGGMLAVKISVAGIMRGLLQQHQRSCLTASSIPSPPPGRHHQ
jgi:hypothetical protein